MTRRYVSPSVKWGTGTALMCTRCRIQFIGSRKMIGAKCRHQAGCKGRVVLKDAS